MKKVRDATVRMVALPLLWSRRDRGVVSRQSWRTKSERRREMLEEM